MLSPKHRGMLDEATQCAIKEQSFSATGFYLHSASPTTSGCGCGNGHRTRVDFRSDSGPRVWRPSGGVLLHGAACRQVCGDQPTAATGDL